MVSKHISTDYRNNVYFSVYQGQLSRGAKRPKMVEAGQRNALLTPLRTISLAVYEFPLL